MTRDVDNMDIGSGDEPTRPRRRFKRGDLSGTNEDNSSDSDTGTPTVDAANTTVQRPIFKSEAVLQAERMVRHADAEFEREKRLEKRAVEAERLRLEERRAKGIKEPSMEEVLAGIRRIIAAETGIPDSGAGTIVAERQPADRGSAEPADTNLSDAPKVSQAQAVQIRP